ncbi:hypothetical protein OIE62_05005 [Streptomyces scopuliridis]|uniref:hypothetical protein n=1 Tax=Streptomyces scopuliridis TaxID=452529 RepID=UPI002DDA6A90|nr:hypothetical protein [Streptomyces scopuliridis]WSC04442.1 hypothetical protein OIE62_05005 [Streptomyces scopuliridis]
MTPGAERIRIIRGRGGQVEILGPLDPLAAELLRRAGFLTFPALSGQWVRLPFDMGGASENEHASWAADMLTVAHYPVTLDTTLRAEHLPDTPSRTRPAAPPSSTAPAVHHR